MPQDESGSARSIKAKAKRIAFTVSFLLRKRARAAFAALATLAGAVPPKLVRLGGRFLDRQRRARLLGDARLERLHLLERQIGERNAQFLGALDQRAGDAVRLAEGQAELERQPIGEIGGGGITGFGRALHCFFIGFEIAYHPGDHGQAQLQRVEGFEHRGLVLLHVLGIGQAAGPSSP